MEPPLQLRPYQVRYLKQWRTLLDADRVPAQLVVRILRYFGLIVAAGVLLPWLVYEQGYTEIAIFMAGTLTGVCIREAKNIGRFFDVLPIAKQIMCRDKIDELLRGGGH